jgi:phosphoglycerate dehydrogenase-like enzyme
MPRLDVFLQTGDPLFCFNEVDFKPLQAAIPELEIVHHQTEADLLTALPDIECLDTWVFEEAWFAKAPKLKQLFTPAAGRDYVKTHPDVITNFGTFHGELMAETTLGLMLNFSLRLPEFQRQQENAVWQRLPLRRLANQTALILGYGSIGRVCGQLLSRFGMTVFGVQRQPPAPHDGGVQVISVAELTSYLPKADHIISFLPGGENTQHFIGARELQLMSPTAYFYNLGRGTTVDEQALLAALQNEKLAGAALDVTEIEPLPKDSPLWGSSRLVLLPHTSAYFEEYRHAHVTELTNIIGTSHQTDGKN